MLRKNFNKAFASYDQHADVQTATGNQLLTYLQKNQNYYRNIMDVGCGTGLVTKAFASKLFFENFYAIDIAEQLLMQAKKQLREFPIHISENDFQNFNPECQFDLIYANMSLHWSGNLTRTIQRLLSFLEKKGVLAFSIPLNDTFKELQSKVSLRSFATKESILPHFNIVHFAEEYFTLHFPSFIDACRSIKNVGANFVERKVKGLKSNTYLRELLLNNTRDSTTLTYHIGYFILEDAHGK